MSNTRESFLGSYNPSQKEGEEIERELLGTVKITKDIREERSGVEKMARQKNITEFDAALEDIRNRQSGNPLDPSQPFASFVRARVVDELKLSDEDEKNLKFFTAVSGSENKTVLDRDFGIDAFVEFLAKNKKSIIITLDVTLKLLKENQKAEIVFSIPEDFPAHARFENNKLVGLTAREQDIFFKYIADLASQIAERIKKTYNFNSENE